MDVIASQRLGYKRTIYPTLNPFNNIKTIQLEDPQSQRWGLDDVLWNQNLDLLRNDKSANHCIALCGDGIVLLDTSDGKLHWKFRDPHMTEWGNGVRGCPSTFQPQNS